MLGVPFATQHPSDADADAYADEVEFRNIDDPRTWKCEYHCPVHGQSVACRFGR